MNDLPRPRGSVTTSDAGPAVVEHGQLGCPIALTVVHSPDARAKHAISLGPDLLVVGRDVGTEGASIDDARLSRVHFRVAFDGRAGSHRLGDARSRNGTFVGGKHIESIVLRPGDVIRAGDSVFVYGNPDPTHTIRDRVERIARSDVSVLLLGETGTGKERLARALHEASGRQGPFVAVNCASLPGGLLATELFGHARGAFSGAVDARRGLFQTANEGTLFLDEVADAPMDLQAVLLRALQEGAIRPIGSDREIFVKTRVVAATHVDLNAAVREGRFRADLFARLAHMVVTLPALRERRGEILQLAAELARYAGCADWWSDADAAEALTRFGWPYNVRELEALMRVFVAMDQGSKLDSAFLKEHKPDVFLGFRGEADAAAPKPSERPGLEALLAQHGGNVSAVAKELRRPRAQIYRQLKALGLNLARFRTRD